jgi:hypothetical protein
MPDAWIRFKEGVSRDLLRVRRASNFPGPQSRQLKRIIAGVISALVVLQRFALALKTAWG